MLVAAALLMVRQPNSVGSLASRGPVVAAASAVDTVPVTAVRLVPRPLSSSGRLIRDPQLDRYLAAHQHFAGTSALGVSSGLVRNAVAEDPPR
jgi:sigma-E factor negative regulatory protein RseA